MKDLLKKYWFIGLIILVITCFAVYQSGKTRGQMKQMLKTLEVMEKDTKGLRDGLEKANSELEKTNSVIEEKIGKVDAKIDERFDKIEADRVKDTKRLDDLVERSEDLPPEDLVSDIRSILGTNDVWKTDDGIVFSVTAFRSVSQKLYDWKDFTAIREPRYKQELIDITDFYKTKIYLLQDENTNLKSMVKNSNDMISAQDIFMKEMKKFIVHEMDKGFWGTVSKVGNVVALGVGAVYIIKDITNGKSQ